MKFGFSTQIFEKYPNIKFHENPSSGSRVVWYGQTDMTKLMVAFRSFANAPKIVTKDKNLCWMPASSLTLGDAVELQATAPYSKLDPSNVCSLQQRRTQNVTLRIKTKQRVAWGKVRGQWDGVRAGQSVNTFRYCEQSVRVM
jgi:hypothetical protein